MLPVQKPTPQYRTLDEIRLRKEELAESLQRDNQQFEKLWKQLFVPRTESTKGEFISGLISNGITAFDTFLLVRKLLKNYGGIFGRKKRK